MIPSSPPRVLLVEDDTTARVSLSRVLSRAGYAVDTVPDGTQALAMLSAAEHQGRFDIVLTDLLLGDLDGVQVLKWTRSLPDPPEVILLTGYGTLQTAIESLRSGAYDYLLKPCKPEDLLRCLNNAAQRRAERSHQPSQ